MTDEEFRSNHGHFLSEFDSFDIDRVRLPRLSIYDVEAINREFGYPAGEGVRH